MSLDIFEETKRLVPIQEVAHLYGFEADQAGFIPCPFHNEDTPSLKLYPEGRGWHCFGCNTGGSTIDFVARLFSLSPLEAARKLADDFSLGIEHRPYTAKERTAYAKSAIRRQKEATITSRFEAHLSSTLLIVQQLVEDLRQDKQQFSPQSPDDTYNKCFVYACKWLDYWEYIEELLIIGDVSTQLEVCKKINPEEKHGEIFTSRFGLD